jgi:hypothetical protein
VEWPALTAENRLWTRWWWMGGAQTPGEITRQLEALRAAGFGGVEVSPIYGVRGAESLAKPFLSDPWLEMLAHTLKEADRLGLGVDMIEGTGWPFGGPWIGPQEAAKRLRLTETEARSGQPFSLPPTHPSDPKATLSAAMAVSASGTVVELNKEGLVLDGPAWTPPPGRWTVYAAYLGPTGQQVKRAGPGGDGSVLDHFDPGSVARYLARFDTAFARLKELSGGKMPRCLFNDSWEVYGANATPILWAEFQKRRGYDLRRHLHHLKGDGDPETVQRVRTDYRRTMEELAHGFLDDWRAHAHKHGTKSRNQAHGSPGNLLDFYAAADIPETEMFGASLLKLVGMEPLPGTPTDEFALEQFFISKIAASAGNVTGKPLISSESFTWLGEHFKTPLSHVRAEADLLFAAGINHLFCHGTPYSPADAEWPGWLFYASTHFGPTNTFWRDLPALTAHIARCQSLLQSGVSDNDFLLYVPFTDAVAADAGAKDLLQFFTVHSEVWLRKNLPAFHAVQTLLWKRGWQFDHVSDRMLTEALTPEKGILKTRAGAAYRAVVVTGCRLLEPETAERLRDLARAGVPILLVGGLPDDVPGMTDREARRARLQAALSELRRLPNVHAGTDVETLLARVGLRRESVTDAGTLIRRRRIGDGYVYYLNHVGKETRDGWVDLTARARSAVWMDPATGRVGKARIRHDDGDRATVYLRMEPGETLLLRTFAESETDVEPFSFYAPEGGGTPLTGPWQVEFVEGWPTLPASRTIPALTSWTDWTPRDETDANALRAFSGTALYRIAFDAPAGAKPDGYELSLGTVHETARMRLNGQEVGTVYARPWKVTLPALKPTGNVLEIEITNLMANRLADLDRRGVDWQKFFFVNIQYKPFSAKNWEPVPSGLLGPVRLVPLKRQ